MESDLGNEIVIHDYSNRSCENSEHVTVNHLVQNNKYPTWSGQYVFEEEERDLRSTTTYDNKQNGSNANQEWFLKNRAGPEGDGSDRVCAAMPNLQDHSGSIQDKFCGLCDEVSLVAAGYCKECEEHLCSACIQRHQKMRTIAHHTIARFPKQLTGDKTASNFNDLSTCSQKTLPGLGSSSDRCKKHPDERLRFCCMTCQMLICRDCVLTSHKQHSTEDIADASEAAHQELAAMTGRLQEKKRTIEMHLQALVDYRRKMQETAQRVRELVARFHQEVRDAVESSFQDLTTYVKECQESETERIVQQEKIINQNLENVTKVLDQQPDTLESPLSIFCQRDVVSQTMKTVEENLQHLSVCRSEFFISRNPRLSKIPEDILGRVGFTVLTIPKSNTASQSVSESISVNVREVTLRREFAFNIWEMNCTKPSVRSIVKAGPGTVWVATPRSLIRIANAMTKDSTNIPDDINCISAGPFGKLLVSFGQGNVIKLYSNGSWSGFTTSSRGVTAMATSEYKSQVFIAEAPTTQHPSRILVHSSEGKLSYQYRFPPEIFEASEDRGTAWSSPPGMEICPILKISCMAVGPDGSLCVGDTANERLLMIDSEGNVTGDYRGADGRSGCVPRSVCCAGNGQVTKNTSLFVF